MKDAIATSLNEEELIGLVADLVRIPSHWALPERELPIALHLRDLFQREGIEVELQEALPDRPNVIAVLRGVGGGPSLALNGHIDTVPAVGMDTPFAAEIRDGFMWGRGTSDMKGGVGAMAYTLILLNRLGVKLKGDLYFTGVIDEDSAGSEGSRHVVRNGPRTDYAVVGEPTNLEPVTAHNGIDYFQIVFKGKAAHSSRPAAGVNAIYGASRFSALVQERLESRYGAIRHPLVGPAAVNVGLIKGCARANLPYLDGDSATFAGIVPDYCDVYMDIRWSPLQTFESVEADVRELAREAAASIPGLEAEVVYIPLPRPPMDLPLDTPLFTHVAANIREVLGRDAEAKGATFWTDAGLLNGLAGIPTLVLGPGDIACAHGVDERIEVKQLAQAARIYAGLALDLCGIAR